MIQTLCYLLETLLTPENTPPDTAKDIYELYFVFAAIWAFGGFLFKDEVSSYIASSPASFQLSIVTMCNIKKDRMRLGLCEQALHGMNLHRFGIGSHKLFCSYYFLLLPYSLLTIVLSSPSGGWQSSSTSSFPPKALSLTTSLTMRQRNGFRGQRKYPNSLMIQTCPYRYNLTNCSLYLTVCL